MMNERDYGLLPPSKIFIKAAQFFHPNVDPETKEIKIPLQFQPTISTIPTTHIPPLPYNHGVWMSGILLSLEEILLTPCPDFGVLNEKALYLYLTDQAAYVKKTREVIRLTEIDWAGTWLQSDSDRELANELEVPEYVIKMWKTVYC
jgi:ubiquitin-protein ligase